MSGILPCEEKHEGPCGWDLQSCESSAYGKKWMRIIFSLNRTVLRKLSETTASVKIDEWRYFHPLPGDHGQRSSGKYNPKKFCR